MSNTFSPIEISCFVYLEELRKSGETNMYGAVPYLKIFLKDNYPYEEELTASDISYILGLWMKNYELLIDRNIIDRVEF
tara:strand:+ start:489 stop:725 length:237 start_codon:yes stop_codon:yes gene_type:complete